MVIEHSVKIFDFNFDFLIVQVLKCTTLILTFKVKLKYHPYVERHNFQGCRIYDKINPQNINKQRGSRLFTWTLDRADKHTAIFGIQTLPPVKGISPEYHL